MDTQPTSVELTFRPARADDLETLLEIQREAAVAAFAHVFPPETCPFPSDDIRERWRKALADPALEIHVAESNRGPVASVSVDDEFLRTLYVLPSHQGTGVGSKLHDFALKRLRARGCTRAKLWTLEQNQPARRFYERRGWRLTEETRIVPFPPNPMDVQYAKDLSGP
jgi:GNAT superfamily N-acetyltransferase